MGVIPILFEIETSYTSLNDDILSLYTLIETDTVGKQIYLIDEDTFISNFKSFYEEFNLLIYNDEEVFSNDSMMRYDSEVADIEMLKYIVFYQGSYKAYLEEYSTFLHFERALDKAITNPLAKVIKIGLYG